MIELATLPGESWDAAVIGAGPAGAAAATLLADRGWRVLLVEKSRWPRDKACGGCVNADAIATLRRLKLQGVLRGATAMRAARISHFGERFDVAAGGVAIERSQLDQQLVAQAIERGVCFLPATAAKLQPAKSTSRRSLLLSNRDNRQTVDAKIVLACDGINGTLLRDEPWSGWSIDRAAWMGVSTSLDAGAVPLASDRIHLHIGTDGYVGLVRLPRGEIHLGAALDARRSRTLGGPARHVESILADNHIGISVDSLLGTGQLTRRRRTLGGQRVLCVGDACGYVEPFTGEGIAWALASAEAAVSLLSADATTWADHLPKHWERLHRAVVGRRQTMCRLIRFAVRRPRLWRTAMAVARRWPTTAEWFAPRPSALPSGDRHD